MSSLPPVDPSASGDSYHPSVGGIEGVGETSATSKAGAHGSMLGIGPSKDVGEPVEAKKVDASEDAHIGFKPIQEKPCPWMQGLNFLKKVPTIRLATGAAVALPLAVSAFSVLAASHVLGGVMKSVVTMATGKFAYAFDFNGSVNPWNWSFDRKNMQKMLSDAPFSTPEAFLGSLAQAPLAFVGAALLYPLEKVVLPLMFSDDTGEWRQATHDALEAVFDKIALGERSHGQKGFYDACGSLEEAAAGATMGVLGRVLTPVALLFVAFRPWLKNKTSKSDTEKVEGDGDGQHLAFKTIGPAVSKIQGKKEDDKDSEELLGEEP